MTAFDAMMRWIGDALRCQRALSREHRSVLVRRPKGFIYRRPPWVN